jgi:hypothetical protein
MHTARLYLPAFNMLRDVNAQSVSMSLIKLTGPGSNRQAPFFHRGRTA